jgi:multidrug efflux system membrane fusion protein
MKFTVRRLALNSLCAALAVTAWSGCNRAGAGSAKAGGPAPVPVQTAVALQQDVPRSIDSVGAVQALRTVSVKSQVDGMIAEVHFREGDEVKAGDLLVSLDRRPFENSLRIARADLANAKAEAVKAAADAERYTNLNEKDAISKEQFAQLTTKAETTRAQVQAKEAAVSNAELLLSYAQIRAPIAGRTGQLLLHEGALVKANDNNFAIVAINQLTPISVAYSVPEGTFEAIRTALVANNATVTVLEKASGLRRDDGKLKFIDNAVDPTTGMITLKAEFPNTDKALWPGRFVTVTTEFGVDRGATVVPAPAIQTSQNGSTVYVVKPDHSVELRNVTIARMAGEVALIKDGVKPGETVVTDGQLRLLPGMKVESKALADVVSANAQPKKT